MYSLKLHDKVYDDLKVLDNALVIKVFKKLKQIQQSPQIGENLGNKNGMNLSGFKKVYIDKKRVRIVFEVQDDIAYYKGLLVFFKEEIYLSELTKQTVERMKEATKKIFELYWVKDRKQVAAKKNKRKK